jgi:hypothetical protein
MNRRPWPIILLSIQLFLSPLIYVAVASLYYDTSFLRTANEVIALASPLRKFELFVLPLLLGGFLLVTKRPGYYVVIAGCLYQIIRGVIVFRESLRTDPVFPLVLVNLFSAAALLYLLRPNARMVYFNPKIRWWEADKRYLVNYPSSITRVGGQPIKASIANIAYGGAKVETLETEFIKDEKVVLEFHADGETYRIESRIAWERIGTGNVQLIGLAWTDSGLKSERSKIRRHVRTLRERGFPTTLPPETWSEDLRAWIFGPSRKR